MIEYGDAARLIAKERGDAAVVTTMTQSRFWGEVSTHRELDIGISNGMGKASSVGLGIALGRPDRKVIVLDGDGSLLMNLGSLVTVASQEPKNLYIFVFDNGVYAVTGGQPVPGANVVDYARMALGAGFPSAHSFADVESLATELPGIMRGPGPVLVTIKTKTVLPKGPVNQTWESNARMPAAFRSVRKALTGS
jgi:thiamine pyrophosphate-dependent acetolactate synthase large subunit-like protein